MTGSRVFSAGQASCPSPASSWEPAIWSADGWVHLGFGYIAYGGLFLARSCELLMRARLAQASCLGLCSGGVRHLSGVSMTWEVAVCRST